MARKAPIADLALDLGTASTRLIGPSGLLREIETVIAMRGREVLAVGEAAARLDGRTTSGVDVVRPVRGGSVVDFRAAERLLGSLISDVAGRGIRKPRILIALGSESSDVERRAALESVRAAGARDVAVIDRMVAAGVGVGLPVTEPIGHLVIDAGAGGTRAAVLSLGAPVVERASPIGGDALNDAIQTWFRDQRRLVVETRTAENLKLHLVDLLERTTRQIRIRGRAIGSQAPAEDTVATADITAAVAPQATRMREIVRDVLRRASPELSADLLDRGAVITGGGAALSGLAELLRSDTDLAVVRAEDSAHAVTAGCAAVLSDAELYRMLAAARP